MPDEQVTRRDGDAWDTEPDLAGDPRLRDALAACCEIIRPTYEAADRAAMRHKRFHQGLAAIAVVCSVAAATFAIVTLACEARVAWIVPIEGAGAGVAFVAVALAFWQARQRRWLLERHKAQRCRSLMFRSLLDPELWDRERRGAAEWRRRLRDGVAEAGWLSGGRLRETAEQEDWLPLAEGAANREMDEAGLAALVDYYRRKRLEDQIAFFEARARSNDAHDRRLRPLSPILFFVSLVAVALHFVLEDSGLHRIGVWLVALAAAVPLLGAGLHTLRSTFEFARSASLYRAKAAILRQLAARLQEAPSGEKALRILWECERYLEAEQREWLRLMLDAEWVP
jgi:hypothetical protein